MNYSGTGSKALSARAALTRALHGGLFFPSPFQPHRSLTMNRSSVSPCCLLSLQRGKDQVRSTSVTGLGKTGNINNMTTEHPPVGLSLLHTHTHTHVYIHTSSLSLARVNLFSSLGGNGDITLWSLCPCYNCPLSSSHTHTH